MNRPLVQRWFWIFDTKCLSSRPAKLEVAPGRFGSSTPGIVPGYCSVVSCAGNGRMWKSRRELRHRASVCRGVGRGGGVREESAGWGVWRRGDTNNSTIAEVNLCLNLVPPNRFSLPDSGYGYCQNQIICPTGRFILWQTGSGTVARVEARHGRARGEP